MTVDVESQSHYDAEPIRHALSIDVEDWEAGAILNLTRRVMAPTRAVVTNTERMFDLVEEAGVKATWFFLGNVAAEFPSLVQKVAAAGHEVGVHGYHHHLVRWMKPEAFQQSIIDAKKTVEDAGGVEAWGFRAPAFSIDANTAYAHDMILEAGFRYDSSLFPCSGPRYGVADGTVLPSWITAPSGNDVYEIPATVLEIGRYRLPCCGGGYFRHFPLAYTRFALGRLERDRRPANFYLHPYEIDLVSPVNLTHPDLSRRDRLRLNTSLRLTEKHGRRRQVTKLRKTLKQFRFGTVRDVFRIADVVGPNELR